MIITTWNINGIRAALNNGIATWVQSYQPDILGFQEIKAKEDQFNPSIFNDMGYESLWNPAQQPGYSGVGVLYKITPISYEFGLNIPIYDKEGRVIHLSYADFELFNVYFPNGGRGQERVQYKLDFYASLLNLCDELHKKGKSIIITGDFNTAHREIDLKNPKENSKISGFLPEERIWIDNFLGHGFIDAYRNLYPERIQYTWWTYRFKARERGIGWRLDYFLISSKLIDRVKDVIIHEEVVGSDHCPVSLEIY